MKRHDYHIHTKYLGCANETMLVPDILRQCEALGVESVAFTDHLNTVDRLRDHEPIRRDIGQLAPSIPVYFGVELNFLGCDEDFAYSEQVREQGGFQFAIGGIHGTYLERYDQAELVRIQHRHHLRTCENPLVDVLVHPYWFGKGEFDRNDWPLFGSVDVVPRSCVKELGEASRETGTAIEINSSAILVNPVYDQESYREFLVLLAESGAIFSCGSDAHDISELASIRSAWDTFQGLGLTEDRLWEPPCPPVAGPGAA